jgi:hypothetical protein
MLARHGVPLTFSIPLCLVFSRSCKIPNLELSIVRSPTLIPYSYSPPRKSFNCNTLMDLPASVAKKRLTVRLNPLDATLTKNRGLGVLWLTRFASRIAVLTNPGSRRTYPNFSPFNHSVSPWQSCFKAPSTGAATISRTRSRSAGTSSFLKPLVSMVSCRSTVIFAGQSIQ